MTKNIVIILVVLGLVGGAWWHGNEHGKDTERTAQLEEEKKLRDELARLRKEGVQREKEFEDRVSSQRRESDAEIQKLVSENKELRQWWSTFTPDDAVDYAYGVRDKSGE